MGQARNRGSFEDRKAQAIASGRKKRKSKRIYKSHDLGLMGVMASIFAPKIGR